MTLLQVVSDWEYTTFDADVPDRLRYPAWGWRRLVDYVDMSGIWRITEWHFGACPPDDDQSAEVGA